MAMLRPNHVMTRAAALLVVVAAVVAGILFWSNFQRMHKPISRSEEISIGNAVAALEHLTGTNIIEIERIRPNRVRVSTRAESGNGGDLLELREMDGEWVLQRRGAWLN